MAPSKVVPAGRQPSGAADANRAFANLLERYPRSHWQRRAPRNATAPSATAPAASHAVPPARCSPPELLAPAELAERASAVLCCGSDSRTSGVVF